jgi:hypothetical protein
MTRLEFRDLPVVQKSITLSRTLRSNIIAALHDGQNVTVIGTPPSVSLTILCRIKMGSG